MDFFPCQQVFSGHARLIVDQGDGILVVLTLKREVGRHHLEGNVAAHVGQVFVTPADALHGTDDLKSDAIE